MKFQFAKNYSKLFNAVLVFLALVYFLGTLFLILAWLGLQSYDMSVWQSNTLPAYALLFISSLAGILGILVGNKWGVYLLAGSWLITGFVTLMSFEQSPISIKNFFFAQLIAISFFLLLLPNWEKMRR